MNRNRVIMLLVTNAVIMFLFLGSVYLLECRAGSVVAAHWAWLSPRAAGVTIASVFWIAALSSWVTTVAVLCQSSRPSRGCQGKQTLPYQLAAGLEALAWLVIWAGFITVFFPAIAAGL